MFLLISGPFVGDASKQHPSPPSESITPLPMPKKQKKEEENKM